MFICYWILITKVFNRYGADPYFFSSYRKNTTQKTKWELGPANIEVVMLCSSGFIVHAKLISTGGLFQISLSQIYPYHLTKPKSPADFWNRRTTVYCLFSTSVSLLRIFIWPTKFVKYKHSGRNVDLIEI